VEVTRRARLMSQLPIIILSVRDRESDKIKALDAGADDYLTKPFGVGELMARMRATLRRTRMGDEEPQARHEIGELLVDLGARLVTRCGSLIHLTPTEFDLLAYLIRHEGKVLTHQLLLNAAWGPGYGNQVFSLRLMIMQLRKKIEADPAHPRLIITETGIGYRFQSPA
jgi:two-component system, OmpR family, KDP operon response regulator KdpE